MIYGFRSSSRRSIFGAPFLGSLLLAASVGVPTITFGVPSAAAAVPVVATPVTLAANGITKQSGNIATGTNVELAFAAQSSVACFPGNKNDHFDGKHVFFRVELPPKSVLKIKATPKVATTDLSVYAYSVAKGDTKTLPPNVPSVVACEAAYGTNNINVRYNPGAAESVEMNAIANPYTVYVGVAGAQKLDKGAFELEFDLKTAAPAATGLIASAAPIAVARGESKEVSGKIDGGAQIDLAFAASSSVACFPATKNDQFNGNQVAYAVELPSNTTLIATLTPSDPKLDLNLYGYTVGNSDTGSLPPKLSSCVSCEASYGTNKISEPFNPGQPEKIEFVAIRNPYRAVLVVAGAQGIKAGAFKLKVELKPR